MSNSWKLVICCTTLLALITAVGAQNARRKARAQRQQQPQPRQPRQQPSTAPADRVYGVQLTDDSGYHTAPAAAETARGDVHVAWVKFVDGQGDTVVTRAHARAAGKTSATPERVLSHQPGQFVRPVLAASGDDLICLWTETAENNRACIWYSRFFGGQWVKAERLLPDESRAHQNPEIAAAPGGRFAVVYQMHNGNDYDIHVRRGEADGLWADPTPISDGSANDWDPVVTFDASKRIHIAYSAFKDGDYDVIWRRADEQGNLAEPKRLSARGEYDMHPWLAAAPNGSVWVSWDVVRLKNHGYSGGSTITGANKQRDLKDTREGEANHWSGVAVRVLDGDTVRIPGDPRRQIVAPQGYVLAHRSLGKIAITSNGEPWVVYRALMKPIAPWSPTVRDGYLWEVLARPFRDGKWQDALVFDGSDGYLEEPALAISDSGIKVAYTTEHRHARARRVAYVTKKPEAPTTQGIDQAYDHHHDFDGLLGWHGDVYLAPLPQALSPDINLASFPVENAPTDRDVDPRMRRDAGTHAVKMSDGEYQLLWGDLHRHSNVSRCSVGNEPNPEDLYRYGIDINMYDFLALSDHAEYTTDYYWWRQQKVADLFHIPGVMSILYNYEWSMPFPQGHTNTVFATRNNFKMSGKTGATATLQGGWELLRRGGYKAITTPHTTADPGMGTSWPAYDPQFMRLCEIFQSCRGSYEHDGCPRQHVNATNKKGFYRLALEKGY
jgi:hypothetical protein